MPIYNGIINQKGTPAFYSDIFANRPAFGYAGRVFISTDTGAIYEDTGTSWTLIADAGAGTTGTLQQVTTNGNTTTLGIVVDGININNGAGTGSSNVAIGSGLQNNTTGSANTSLGLNSLTANTTANNNTAIGNNSLQLNTTGANNTSIGSNSLSGNTTASFNTAIGASSLNLNTTGANNTALGNSSLASNTTASFNTAIGATSLQLNTTGGSNTAVGYQSLNANTTGNNNTALGLSALSGNTTASFNTAIGSSSLLNNTTGTQNTAIGYLSLSANTTGTQNTALGNNALQNNTTGSFNTAIGQLSLNTNTTGATNTALGSQSLQLNTTGTLNTAIGNAAGSLITTGSNNTIIGNYGGTSTLTSNIVLSDGGGNVRLFSDANGLIGINQAVGSTIGGQLDIHSTQTYALVLNGLSTSNAYTAFSNASVGKWRIGNTYNAGANSFDIHNLTTTSNAITINATNNVGIGITPSAWGSTVRALQFENGASIASNQSTQVSFNNNVYSVPGTNDYYISSAFASRYIQFQGTHFWQSAASGTAGNPITFSQLMTLFSTGNLVINSTTDDTINKLQVTGSATFSSSVIASGRITAGGSMLLGEIQSSYSIIETTSGNGIWLRPAGASDPTGLKIATTGAAAFSSLAGTGSRAVLADANGVLSAPVSDISVKENINTIGYGLTEILKMKPVWFNYNDEYKNYGEGRQNGNIAQEMEAIIPEAVFTTPTTGKMGINYDQLHAVYIKAIQELKAEIDALKNN